MIIFVADKIQVIYLNHEMNKKEILFWVTISLLIFYFFLVFGVFLFQHQEEGQLFIPTWQNLLEQIGQAGGCSAIAGQFIIQYYRLPMLAVAIHTLLLLGIGFSVYKLLQGIKDKGYHLLLALFPILILLKMSIRGNYLVDGTVALFVMMWALLPLLRLRRGKTIALYGVLSTLILFYLTGLLAICHTVIYVFMAAMLYPKNSQRMHALWCLIPATLFYIFSRQLHIPVSLSEGFQPEEYLEIQLQPHFYIYYVWILFSVLLLGIMAIAYLFSHINKESRWKDMGLNIIILLSVIAFGKYCMPDKWDIQNRMVNELAYLARERQWDTIINRYKGKEIHDYISLNYLNMALAQKGQLAESMFAFDQRGTKSLVSPWNQSLFMTKMLCDVHFCIGDLGMAESYAMDGMTQSKRKGSARMLQRLIQINLLRGETEVARKYLNILKDMPFYRDWAEQQQSYLKNPGKMQSDPELKGKFMPQQSMDKLFSLMTTDSLWSVHPPKSIGWEYLGCYYLLDKNLEKFYSFAISSGENELPRHFQEAWLMQEKQQDNLAYKPHIRQEIENNYQKFKQLLKIHSQNEVNMQTIYREFGNTYWFYYYFKLFKNQTSEP